MVFTDIQMPGTGRSRTREIRPPQMAKYQRSREFRQSVPPKLAFVSHLFGAPLSSGTLVLTGAAIGFSCVSFVPLSYFAYFAGIESGDS